MFKLMIFALSILFSLPAYAQGYKSPEALISSGFSKFAQGDSKGAIKAWMEGSPLGDSKEIQAQANFLEQLILFYGSFNNHSSIHVNKLTARSQVHYVLAEMESGPVFCYFLSYKNTSNKWVMPQFNCQTEPQAVWPSALLVSVR